MVLIILLASIVIPGLMGRRAEDVPLPKPVEVATPDPGLEGFDFGRDPVAPAPDAEE